MSTVSVLGAALPLTSPATVSLTKPMPTSPISIGKVPTVRSFPFEEAKPLQLDENGVPILSEKEIIGEIIVPYSATTEFDQTKEKFSFLKKVKLPTKQMIISKVFAGDENFSLKDDYANRVSDEYEKMRSSFIEVLTTIPNLLMTRHKADYIFEHFCANNKTASEVYEALSGGESHITEKTISKFLQSHEDFSEISTKLSPETMLVVRGKGREHFSSYIKALYENSPSAKTLIDFISHGAEGAFYAQTSKSVLPHAVGLGYYYNLNAKHGAHIFIKDDFLDNVNQLWHSTINLIPHEVLHIFGLLHSDDPNQKSQKILLEAFKTPEVKAILEKGHYDMDSLVKNIVNEALDNGMLWTNNFPFLSQEEKSKIRKEHKIPPSIGDFKIVLDEMGGMIAVPLTKEDKEALLLSLPQNKVQEVAKKEESSAQKKGLVWYAHPATILAFLGTGIAPFASFFFALGQTTHKSERALV